MCQDPPEFVCRVYLPPPVDDCAEELNMGGEEIPENVILCKYGTFAFM